MFSRRLSGRTWTRPQPYSRARNRRSPEKTPRERPARLSGDPGNGSNGRWARRHPGRLSWAGSSLLRQSPQPVRGVGLAEAVVVLRSASRHPKRPGLGHDASQEAQPRCDEGLRIADLDRPSRDGLALIPDAPNGPRSSPLFPLRAPLDFRLEYRLKGLATVFRTRRLARIPRVFARNARA